MRINPRFSRGLLAGFILFGLTAGAAAQDPAPAPGEAPVVPAPVDEAPAVVPPLEETPFDLDAVVVTINGEEITERDLGMLAQQMGEQLTQYPQENWRQIVIDIAIETTLIAQAADAAAVGDDPNFAAQLALVRARLLQEFYIQQFVAPTVTEQQITEAYDAAVAGMNLPQEVQIRHIMLETEAQANDALLRLNEGADFAELALELSLDRATAELGGLIDAYWAPGELIQEFDDVAFTIPTGEFLPFPVAYGGFWHLIKVDDRRLRSPPAFEDLRDVLRQQLVAQAYGNILELVRENAEIVIAEPPALDDGVPPPPDDAAPAAPADGAVPAPADGAVAPAPPAGE